MISEDRMPRQIEFYFDFVSPYSYLATTQFPRLQAETEAAITYTPFRILELMKQVGNRPTTVECKPKGAYAGADIGRWAARYGVPFKRNPHMRSFDHDLLRRAALVAIEQGQGDAYVRTVYGATWAGEANLAERPALAAVLTEAGLEGEAVLKQADEPRYGELLDKTTEAAAQRGVFGSPTFFVGNQMFFGNDRLDFVAEALKAAA
jgi:2-hydroxychromene-2-carboxylate isomerase